METIRSCPSRICHFDKASDKMEFYQEPVIDKMEINDKVFYELLEKPKPIMENMFYQSSSMEKARRLLLCSPSTRGPSSIEI